jgi:predicted permease
MLKDLAYAVRGLRTAPTFTAIAVVSIALGIGATTTLFTLADAALFQPLAANDPDELVAFRLPNAAPIGTTHGTTSITFSYPMYRAIRDRSEVFSGVLGRSRTQVSLTHGGNSERVRAEVVSGNYFDVLKITPVAGRLLTPEDDRTSSGHPVVVLAYGFWVSRFAADQNLIGSTIALNGRPMTVLGVAPPLFHGVEFTSRSDLFIPMAMAPVFFTDGDRLPDPQRYWVNVVARVKQGISVQTAQAATNVLFRQLLAQDELKFNADVTQQGRKRWLAQTISLDTGRQGFNQLRKQMESGLIVLLGASGFVLLIGCANVANLMLARALKKNREFAVRVALGASRAALVRQVLTESVLISMIGGALGIALAFCGILAVEPVLPATITLPDALQPNLRAMAFTAALSVATGLLFGIVPALRSSDVNVTPTLKDESTGCVSGGSAGKMRNALVMIQVALSVILLVGASLLLTTLKRIYEIDLGFNKEKLLLATVDPSLVGYTPERARAYFDRLEDQVASLAGVRQVTLAKVPVIGNSNWSSGIQVEDRERGRGAFSRFNWVSPGYFKTLGVPLMRGREIGPQDLANSQAVAVVNETFVRRWFGSQNPIGRRFGMGNRRAPINTEIVGVAKDIKYHNVQEPPTPTAYFAYTQHPAHDMTLHVRMAGPIENVVTEIRRVIRDLDPMVPIYDIKTLETQIDQNALGARFMASLTSFFGALATIMAAVGVYGVLAFSVARRTREIGIRMALGAFKSRVLWMIMKQTLQLTAAGLLIGLLGSWVINRNLVTFLYGVNPMEPLPVMLGAIGIVLVALASGYLPALRASRTDPMHALRHE